MSGQDSRLPRKLGRYTLLERIATGGMAVLYRATLRGASGFERVVAVKCIKPELAADKQFVSMFVDEAKIAVQLSHPNIAQVIELGREGETYFIVQEFVPGLDLRAIWELEVKRGSRLPLPILLYVARCVCDALHYAHGAQGFGGQQLQLIHRDITPQNILLSYEGEVKVVDFGLARASGRATRTAVGIVKGKLAYLAPEQLRRGPIDHRVDIFALGVVLWELLTGRRLFLRATDVETVEAVHKGEIPPLRELAPEVPRGLALIVEKALERDPERRFPNAGAMHEALESFAFRHGLIAGRPQLARYLEELDAYRRSLQQRAQRPATAEPSIPSVASPPRPSPAPQPAPDTPPGHRSAPASPPRTPAPAAGRPTSAAAKGPRPLTGEVPAAATTGESWGVEPSPSPGRASDSPPTALEEAERGHPEAARGRSTQRLDAPVTRPIPIETMPQEPQPDMLATTPGDALHAFGRTTARLERPTVPLHRPASATGASSEKTAQVALPELERLARSSRPPEASQDSPPGGHLEPAAPESPEEEERTQPEIPRFAPPSDEVLPDGVDEGVPGSARLQGASESAEAAPAPSYPRRRRPVAEEGSAAGFVEYDDEEEGDDEEDPTTVSGSSAMHMPPPAGESGEPDLEDEPTQQSARPTQAAEFWETPHRDTGDR